MAAPGCLQPDDPARDTSGEVVCDTSVEEGDVFIRNASEAAAHQTTRSIMGRLFVGELVTDLTLPCLQYANVMYLAADAEAALSFSRLESVSTFYVGYEYSASGDIIELDYDAVREIDAPKLSHIQSLVIRRSNLVDLTGFAALDSLKLLSLQDNPQLLTTFGLGELSALPDYVTIARNPALTHIVAPNSDGSSGAPTRLMVSITENSNLQTIDAFDGVALQGAASDAPPAWVRIHTWTNPRLSYLGGFSGMTRGTIDIIAWDLSVVSAAAMPAITQIVSATSMILALTDAAAEFSLPNLSEVSHPSVGLSLIGGAYSTLSLPALASAGALIVHQNAALDSISAPLLADVSQLELVDLPTYRACQAHQLIAALDAPPAVVKLTGLDPAPCD